MNQPTMRNNNGPKTRNLIKVNINDASCEKGVSVQWEMLLI